MIVEKIVRGKKVFLARPGSIQTIGILHGGVMHNKKGEGVFVAVYIPRRSDYILEYVPREWVLEYPEYSRDKTWHEWQVINGVGRWEEVGIEHAEKVGRTRPHDVMFGMPQ